MRILHRDGRSRASLGIVAIVVTAIALLSFGGSAGAAIVPTVTLGSAAPYAVLGASTVTNTGDSTLDRSVGLWAGTDITGFPPGLVSPPGTIDTTNERAHQGQLALDAAYVNAAGRPVTATTPADLVDLELQGGVYAGPDHSPLSLSGPLVLDGAGNLDTVFIFQTDSTLITDSSSTVSLINGAQECNVFWQVGSSATLGTGSTFRGTILAQASVTVTTDVTVHGRALARTGAVTLDDDTFTHPTCEREGPSAPVTTPEAGGTGAGDDDGSGGTGSGDESSVGGPNGPGGPGGPGVPGVGGPPRTGATPLSDTTSPWNDLVRWSIVAALVTGGFSALHLARRRHASDLGR